MGVVFLNSHRAKSGKLNGEDLAEPYVLLCKFFDCGVIDRTNTLDVGFDQTVLDEIPAADQGFDLSFSDIADRTGQMIVEQALTADKKIQVLWSGGIDSTVAMISLLKHISDAERSRIEVVLSMDSVDEYPLFFRRYIMNDLAFKLIRPPIGNHFDDDALIVTGEHGDQLFGSDKLLPMLVNGLAFEDYRVVLPMCLMHKFGSEKKAVTLTEYLQPLINACPQPIETAFNLFWWLNFTIKWQQVSLRMAVFTFQEDINEICGRLRHFFRNEMFQRWAMENHHAIVPEGLASYKLAAKQYVYDFVQDANYLEHKTKEPSLKQVIINRGKQRNERYRVSMNEDFRPLVEVFDKQQFDLAQ